MHYSACLFDVLHDSTQSVLLTETINWNKFYATLEDWFNTELWCDCMLLPSMIGLKMAEDLDLGIS